MYDRTCDQVYGLVVHMIGDRRRSEQIAHETYTEVWITARRYYLEWGSPTAWVVRIAHRRAVAEMRSDRAIDALLSEGSVGDHARTGAARSDPHLTPANIHDESSLYRSYYQALTSDQIAQADRVPPGAVRSRIKSAVLRAHLQ
ncbi:sigma factor [Rhodococcus qingshengii]|uniref:sigma factor n=1 Tax=Rhodococcus qingshengii TaxID=334542 RepID=UPI003F51A517